MNRILIALSLLILVGCKQSRKEETNNAPFVFEMVTIPSVLTTPEQRQAFISEHYWDNFDFADTTTLRTKEAIEQAFVDYISIIMSFSDQQMAKNSIYSLMKKSDVNTPMSDYFREITDKYLYDPNSPFMNDELYIPVLEYVIGSTNVEDIDKTRERLRYEMALRNRVGEKASDFEFFTNNGAKGNLHSLKSDYTIIFFNNPDCTQCREIREIIVASDVISEKVKSKEVTILAVYPDKDIKAWENYQSNIPKEWINSYDKDQKLTSDKVYDLKAIPSLYLLDKDNNVLLKDTQINNVISFISNR